MIKRCCINNCVYNVLRNPRKTPDIQYFHFPTTDKQILKKWTDFVELANRQTLNNNIAKKFLCSEHFEESQFVGNDLKPTAVPSKLRNLSIICKPTQVTNGSKPMDVIVISDSDDDEPQVVFKEPTKKRDSSYRSSSKPRSRNRSKPTTNGPITHNGLVKDESSKDLIVLPPTSPMKLPEVSKPSPSQEDVVVVPLKEVELPQVEKPLDTLLQPGSSSRPDQPSGLLGAIGIEDSPTVKAEPTDLGAELLNSIIKTEESSGSKVAIPLPFYDTPEVDAAKSPSLLPYRRSPSPPSSSSFVEAIPSTSSATPLLRLNVPSPSTSHQEEEVGTEEKEDRINYINEFLHLCRSMVQGDEKGVKILQGLHMRYMKYRHAINQHSHGFGDFLDLTRAKIMSDPDHLYNHLVAVYKYLDQFSELVAPPPPPLSIAAPAATPQEDLANDKLEAQIKRLEKYLEKLDHSIKKLELKELSLDNEDEEESVYILEDRYKKRFVKVWNKLCKLHKQSASVGRASHMKYVFTDSPYPELTKLTKNIEAFINQTKERVFPDFQDIVNIIKETHAVSPIPNYNDITCLEMARKLFTCVGTRLKQRRQKDLRESLLCYATLETSDPKDLADEDLELRSKLEESSKEGQLKVQKIVDEFALKQAEVHRSKTKNKKDDTIVTAVAEEEDTSSSRPEEEEDECKEEEDDEEEEEEDEEEDKDDEDKEDEDKDEVSFNEDESIRNSDEESEEEEEGVPSTVALSIFEPQLVSSRKRKAEDDEAPCLEGEPPNKLQPHPAPSTP